MRHPEDPPIGGDEGSHR